MLRLVAPESWLATHAFPLAFALGFGLTIMYVCSADNPQTGRGGAAAATWIFARTI